MAFPAYMFYLRPSRVFGCKSKKTSSSSCLERNPRNGFSGFLWRLRTETMPNIETTRLASRYTEMKNMEEDAVEHVVKLNKKV